MKYLIYLILITPLLYACNDENAQKILAYLSISRSPADLNLICREINSLYVSYPMRDPAELETQKTYDIKEKGDTYRFVKNKLYITNTSSSTGEYYYNDIYEAADMQYAYRSGHKLISFLDQSKKKMTAVHSNETYTVIKSFDCLPGAAQQ